MKTHWKKYHNPNYMGAWALLEGEQKTVTIKESKEEKVTDPTGNSETCHVIHFKEDVKPLILNVTNSKKITSLLSTPYIEEWNGKKIGLYVDENVKAFGTTTRAIRVCAPKKGKQVLKKGTDKYKKAVAKLESGEVDIETIKKHYEVPNGFPQ